MTSLAGFFHAGLAYQVGAALALIAAIGIVQAGFGLREVLRFARMSARRQPPLTRPDVTILKPLHGDEPLLEAALESFFTLDYPSLQLVFGVQSPTDPAIAVVRTLRHRYPGRDVALVIDSARHGANHKINNIINMLGMARHGILVVADSDVHATPDYLDHIVGALQQPGTGVVTTLYAGRAAHPGLVGTLGASYISHIFLPGALLARALGRQDCLGATMALYRTTLNAIGGFAALMDYLADDAVLGQLVVHHGLAVRLAGTVPTTTVPETTFAALYQHELRWARTIRSLAPVGHAFSLVQFPIFWGLLAILVSGGAKWAIAVAFAAWCVRAGTSRVIDRRLRLPSPAPIWWTPVRDIMSVIVILASYRGRSVQWRGHVVAVGQPNHSPRGFAPAPYRATEHVLGEG